MNKNEYLYHVSKRLNKIKPKWEKYPFPHTVIDNFLPDKLFKKINKEFKKAGELKDQKRRFDTHVELNKKVFGDKDLNTLHQLPIKILGGDLTKNLIQKYIGKIKLISLCEWKDYGGYYPYHSMTRGGILGSHVDHSHSKFGDLHVANSIFYSSPSWKDSWGGETILFDSFGLGIKKRIFPKPNRLIIFIHSAFSFHGVNKVKSPKNKSRTTYYMDYYIKDKNLEKLKNNFKKNNFTNSKYTFHSTSFLPLFPLGLSSFEFKSLFKKNTYPYFIVYLKYLMTRFFLDYNFVKKVKQIFN
tara:strand:- start:8348 stop:9244 length:897 start_codon:yes stop_codon:yes gene_type:complete